MEKAKEIRKARTTNPSDTCAYAKCCKGICNSSSCIKNSKTEKKYWSEIQLAMVAKSRLDRIEHYLSQAGENPRIDIIKRWATLGEIEV